MRKAFKTALIVAGVATAYFVGNCKGCVDTVKFMFDNDMIEGVKIEFKKEPEIIREVKPDESDN